MIDIKILHSRICCHNFEISRAEIPVSTRFGECEMICPAPVVLVLLLAGQFVICTYIKTLKLASDNTQFRSITERIQDANGAVKDP
jgi:hypothetical protein